MSSDQLEQPTETPRIFLSLGSNLGSRFRHISDAIRRMRDKGLLIDQRSSLYETQPVEVSGQPDFINMNCEIKTSLEAEQLLQMCLDIERTMGRVRAKPKGPRTIDIDILFYGQRILQTNHLSIPHPAVARRRFVLIPMVEIAPEFRDPISGLTMREVLVKCPDPSAVRVLSSFDFGL